MSTITTSLRQNGYKIESRSVFRAAFRSYLKFSDILYNFNISSHRDENLSIQIDSEPQNFDYEPDMYVLNKFDVFQRIPVVPPQVLLAQKLACLFLRPRKMGRDFFDILFLLGKTKPDMNYLRSKVGIQDVKDLKHKIARISKDLSFEKMARDVEPFLYDPQGTRKVRQFIEIVETLDI
jgi:hypothetical protein